MRQTILSTILGFLTVIFLTNPLLAEPITTETLIREMIDMHRLAEFPKPAYSTVQFSSYDHRSVLPGGPDWFANSDGFGNEPIPNFEAVLAEPNEQGIGRYLICDVTGPGAIVRVWTAAIKGTIQMFLDDANEPIYDGPAQEFFLHPYKRYAEAAGIEDAVFIGTFQQANCCYFPFPFAKRCRIVWTGSLKEIHFYQIQIRRYVPAAEVLTFKPEDFKTYQSQIRRVARILSNPQSQWRYTSWLKSLPIDITVQPQQIQEVLSVEGPKAIERLTLKVSASDLDSALRQTILHIRCDDYPWGQVQSPIGDFFGAAPGINPFNSVPFTVEPDSNMTCRFVMPFAKSFKMLLENQGSQPVTVTGSILPMDYKWNDDSSMHFYARWRVDHDIVANGGFGPQDMPYLVANGTGLYVGTALMLLNPNPVPTPWGSWWGEGDEKIFVDGDVRPSTFGTSSEDYFNYAWSSPDIFVYPYCGQPRNDGPANRGFVTNHRWHILDALPFRQRLSFYMELYSHECTPDISYARIAYHYGRPGITDDHVSITKEDVRHIELPANWLPAARAGSQGYMFYQAEDLIQTKTNTAFLDNPLWAGGRLLVWQPAKAGEELTFKLPIPEDGKYIFQITAAQTPTSGSFSVRLDGKSIGFGDDKGIIDLYVPYRTLSRAFAAKPIKLTKGDHLMTLRYEPDTHGGDGKTVGLDFIWVKKQ